MEDWLEDYSSFHALFFLNYHHLNPHKLIHLSQFLLTFNSLLNDHSSHTTIQKIPSLIFFPLFFSFFLLLSCRKGSSARKEAQIWVWLSPTVKLFRRLISFVALLLQCSNLEWKMSSPFFFIKSRMFIEICRRENVIIFSDKKKIEERFLSFDNTAQSTPFMASIRVFNIFRYWIHQLMIWKPSQMEKLFGVSFGLQVTWGRLL